MPRTGTPARRVPRGRSAASSTSASLRAGGGRPGHGAAGGSALRRRQAEERELVSHVGGHGGRPAPGWRATVEGRLEPGHRLVGPRRHDGSSSCFRSRFRILPAGLRGSGSGRNQMRTGTLNAASRSATWACSSASVTSMPGSDVHDRADLLAQHLVGDADDRGVVHRRVLVERGLDLDAVHVLAAADDHVLGPVDDVDEALVVEPGHVAGVEPAVGEAGRGLRRLVEVALHDVRALDPELADLTDRQRGAVGVDDLHVADRHRHADAVGLGR